MATLGLSCNVQAGRLVVRGVAINDGIAEEVFLHKTRNTDEDALQLCQTADALTTRLADLKAESVVVRTADHHASRGLSAAVALRIRAEGVLLATARGRVDVVRGLNGREIGEVLGESKAVVEQRATGLLSKVAMEATAAALAADQLS